MEFINYIQEMYTLSLQGKPRGVFFFISVYFLLMLMYSLIRQFKTRSWPCTTGDLFESGVEQIGGTEWVKSERNYKVSALYRFVVKGQEYQGKKVSPWSIVATFNAKFILEKQLNSIEHLPNGKIRVYYNPRNPNKCFLIKPSSIGIFVTAAFSLMPFFFYWVKYHG